MFPEKKKISFEDFLIMDESHNELLEYIDGDFFMHASPSTAHQRTSLNLGSEFRNYFKNTPCEVFIAPFDIILTKENLSNPNKVIPDISVICDKSGLGEKNYKGVPSLIVEILSPSNQAHDFITKMNLYQKFGVKEYWIVDPRTKSVQLFVLEENDIYEIAAIYKNDETACSVNFTNLKINLSDLFG